MSKRETLLTDIFRRAEMKTYNTWLLFFMALVSISAFSNADSTTTEAIAQLQQEWAKIKYQVFDRKEQIKQLRSLEEKGGQYLLEHSDAAELKIWQAIILSTDAGVTNNLSSLGMLKKAKVLLTESIELDPEALSGSAYTSLASLYYQAPSWPISFGSDKKARKYFKQALVINPRGIDSNYFYGDFLIKQKDYGRAKEYLNKALSAKPRAGRKLADEGRRQEIQAALAAIANK